MFFVVRRRNKASIVDKMRNADTYCYAADVATSFAHYTTALITDTDYTKAVGGSFGKVYDNFIDTRGVFGPFGISLPGCKDKTSSNYQLRPQSDYTKVKLRLEFWVTYQTQSQMRPAVLDPHRR